MNVAVNHLSAMTGGESGFVRHMWRTNANCPPRMADHPRLSAAFGTQRHLRAIRDLQTAQHTCRTNIQVHWRTV